MNERKEIRKKDPKILAKASRSTLRKMEDKKLKLGQQIPKLIYDNNESFKIYF